MNKMMIIFAGLVVVFMNFSVQSATCPNITRTIKDFVAKKDNKDLEGYLRYIISKLDAIEGRAPIGTCSDMNVVKKRDVEDYMQYIVTKIDTIHSMMK